MHNLRKICDEIFGEGNFIKNYIWESTFRPDNSSTIFRENTQHILAYANNLRSVKQLIGDRSGSDGIPSLTKNSMTPKILKFPKGKVTFKIGDRIYEKGLKDSGYELLDDVIVENGKNLNDFQLRGRVIWGQENLLNEIEKGTEIIIKSEGFVPYTKKIETRILAPNSLIPREKVGDVLQGRAELANLIGSAIFDYPKPTKLIQYLISNIDDNNFIILDFFSGSATTAHAVMQLNAEDQGNRKYIMVQLPEATDEKSEAYKAGYKNICEIGKERIRRAAASITNEEITNYESKKAQLEKLINAKLGITKEELSFPEGVIIDEKAEEMLQEIRNLQFVIHNSDKGFRVYRLDTSNVKDVYYTPQGLSQASLDLFADNVKDDRTAEDLVTQVMLDWGLELSLPIERKTILGKEVYAVAGDSLYCCFDQEIDEAFAKEIAKDQPMRIVFRDNSFKDDTAKENVKQLLKQLAPNTEMKVF